MSRIFPTILFVLLLGIPLFTQGLYAQPNAAVARCTVLPPRINLRAGPGTTYPVVGQASAGESFDIIAQNAAHDWYWAASGPWIYAPLVECTSTDVPDVQNVYLPQVHNELSKAGS